jgi:hypothetical protein
MKDDRDANFIEKNAQRDRQPLVSPPDAVLLGGE